MAFRTRIVKFHVDDGDDHILHYTIYMVLHTGSDYIWYLDEFLHPFIIKGNLTVIDQILEVLDKSYLIIGTAWNFDRAKFEAPNIDEIDFVNDDKLEEKLIYYAKNPNR